jgi:cytochrome c biogenesis protein ResB
MQKREKMFSSCFFASLSLAHLYIRITLCAFDLFRRGQGESDREKKRRRKKNEEREARDSDSKQQKNPQKKKER